MPLYRMNVGSSTITEHVATAPNTTGHPVTNLYFDPATGKIVGEYDDAGAGSGTIVSDPPAGKYPITNIFFDPTTGRMTGEYDDGV